MRAAAVAFAVLLSTPLDGGVVYHFTTVATGTHGVTTTAGRVWSQGAKYRVELDPSETPRQYDIAISHDADLTATQISLSRKTIFDRPPHRGARSSMLFHLPRPGANIDGKPAVRHRKRGKETIAGYETTEHVVQIDYKLLDEWDGSLIRGDIHATVKIAVAEQLPPLPFRRGVQTGFAHVDREITRVFEKIPGMVLRHELKVSRQLEKGPIITETVTTTIDELQLVDVPDEMFEVPVEFR